MRSRFLPDEYDDGDAFDECEEYAVVERICCTEEKFFEDLQDFEGENAEDRGRSEAIARAERFNRCDQT